ncbi:Vms1/Ankzf1 family peptidyl-tRNA hydrolase [Streptomyces sp. M19]
MDHDGRRQPPRRAGEGGPPLAPRTPQPPGADPPLAEVADALRACFEVRDEQSVAGDQERVQAAAGKPSGRRVALSVRADRSCPLSGRTGEEEGHATVDPSAGHRTSGPWASVYADVSHSTEDAAKQLELMAGATAGLLSELGADIATCDAMYDALVAVRTDGLPGDHAGRALFATSGRSSWTCRWPGRPRLSSPTGPWRPARAPGRRHRGRSAVPDRVREPDRRGLRAARRHRRQRGRSRRGADWPIHRTASADWSERHFQTRVENTWEQNAAEIGDAARRAYERTGAELLLLAGDPRERRAVHDRLPEPLRAVTYESEHGGRAAGADSAPLERDIAQVRAVHELEHVADTVGRFRTGAQGGTDGEAAYAAAGVPALVEAAREHRIGTLLLAPDGPDAGREIWWAPSPTNWPYGARSCSTSARRTRPRPARTTRWCGRPSRAAGTPWSSATTPKPRPAVSGDPALGDPERH